MPRSSDKVKAWRKRTKLRMIASMGGCCQICDYDKYHGSLELHHLDPDEKELGFGRIMSNPVSWERLVNEMRKCVLLCSNCHKELHAGVTELPEDYARFDESWVDYKAKEKSMAPGVGLEPTLSKDTH